MKPAIRTTWIDCPGCAEEFVEGSGYEASSYLPEEFCTQDCHDNEMERRQERLVERT